MKQVLVALCLWLALLGMVMADEDAGEKVIIAQVIDDSIGWFKTKNFDRLFEIFPLDPNLLIFSPRSTDTVVGGQAFRDSSAIWRDPDNVYVRHSVSDLKITLSESKTVAWWSAILEDCGSYKGKEGCWKECRWTGVLEKRGGKWVIAQGHFSFASDKVAAEIRAKDAAPAEKFADYASMRKRVGELFAQKKYATAAAILREGLEQFPDRAFANTYNLALTALLQNDLDKTVYWLEESHRRNLFFGKWDFLGDMWQPLSGHARFLAFQKENETRLIQAQTQGAMKLELVKPAGYDPKRKYPLFIALHGGGENLDEFKPRWTSPRLQKEFVVAYVQSSQVASMTGFHWQEDAVTKKELAQAYQDIMHQVSIDPKRVFIGGFSSGGYGSLVALFSGVIPAKGFVILCPELPPDPDDKQVLSLQKLKIRGTLLTSELDQRLERQKAFTAFMTQHKLPVRLVVTPNIGHWYPENLAQLIDEALNRLR